MEQTKTRLEILLKTIELLDLSEENQDDPIIKLLLEIKSELKSRG